MDSFALTDHGNMNGTSYQVLHAKKMTKEGKDFKPIYGVEAYFIPSVEVWKEEYEKIKEAYKKLVKQLMELDHNEQIGEQILTQSGKTLENVREEHRDSIRDGLLG